MSDPINLPLRFSSDGFYRVAADMQCKKCGQRFVQVLRCHRYATELQIVTGAPRPNPSDVKIVTTLLLKAHDHGVGNKKLHSRGCPVAKMPSGKHILAGVGDEGGVAVTERALRAARSAGNA